MGVLQFARALALHRNGALAVSATMVVGFLFDFRLISFLFECWRCCQNTNLYNPNISGPQRSMADRKHP